VDQNGETSELVAYETASLTGIGRYNLTYLRRGAYGSVSASHTAGALFAFLGSNYQFANYQFGPSLMGHTLYLKLQSFNLVGKQVQDLSTCAVWEFTLGFQTGVTGDIYFPSQGTQLSGSGLATLTGIDNAFNGSFSTASVFDAGPFVVGGGVVAVNYTGFPKVELSYSAVLYVSYQNMRGIDEIPAQLGGNASVAVFFNGSNSGISMVESQHVLSGPSQLSVSAPQGTATIGVPAGTDISQIVVLVIVGNNVDTSGSGGGGTPGHIEILRIWIQ
jgi:hypothetical protein